MEALALTRQVGIVTNNRNDREFWNIMQRTVTIIILVLVVFAEDRPDIM